MSAVPGNVCGMYETTEERARLGGLVSASRSGGTKHLRAIITEDSTPRVDALLARLEGMRILALSTVTQKGDPRVSAVDGHFLHGQWTFGTDGSSAKARHMRRRPSVSAAHLDGVGFGVFVHGTAVPVVQGDDWCPGVVDHWRLHYGSDPFTWADDIRMFRIVPSWMVAYTPRSDG